MISNVLKQLSNWLEQRKTWHTVSYGRLKIKFDHNPRKNICAVCGLHGYTNIHHTCYNFTYTEIRANFKLGLMFTVEVCYNHHNIANSIRKLIEADPKIKIKSQDKHVQRLVEIHEELLAKRDEYNAKHPK